MESQSNICSNFTFMSSFHIPKSLAFTSVTLKGLTGTRECVQPFFSAYKLFFFMFVCKVFSHLSNGN